MFRKVAWRRLKTFHRLLLRRLGLLAGAFLVAHLIVQGGQQTTWFKERMGRLLLTGDTNQQATAAAMLARVGGEQQLLRALLAEDPGIHELARRALDHLWFTSAGDEAYGEMAAACQAAEREDFKQALEILGRLIIRHPEYAEAWNRRGAVHSQMGQYEASKADCQRALKLNPHHYSAWQGLGVCHLQLGELPEACRSLRAALKIVPHDATTRQTLRQCEELLRRQPPKQQHQRMTTLI